MKKISIKNNGFSLIEMMTAVAILTIILSLSMAQLNEAQVRAKYSSLKVNMRNLQNLVENYSINYGGLYPGIASELKGDAISNKYWKGFKNPFTAQEDSVKDVTDISSLDDLEPGCVLYGGADSNATFVDIFNNNFDDKGSYVIYGVDRVRAPLTISGKIYYVSNN